MVSVETRMGTRTVVQPVEIQEKQYVVVLNGTEASELRATLGALKNLWYDRYGSFEGIEATYSVWKKLYDRNVSINNSVFEAVADLTSKEN